MILSPDSRAREWLFVALVLVFLGMSVFVWTDPTHMPVHQDSTHYLNDTARAGLDVWRRENCQVCHQLYGFGGFLGPDLTNAVTPDRADADFGPILYSGYGKMPALELSDEDQSAVLGFLREMGRTGVSLPPPLASQHVVDPVLHFQTLTQEWARRERQTLAPTVQVGIEQWERLKCGSCHTPFARGRFRSPDLTGVAINSSASSLESVVVPGRGNMPGVTLNNTELAALSSFLEWLTSHRTELVRLNHELLAREYFTLGGLPWFEYR